MTHPRSSKETEPAEWESEFDERFSGEKGMITIDTTAQKDFIRHHIHLAEERGRNEMINVVLNELKKNVSDE